MATIQSTIRLRDGTRAALGKFSEGIRRAIKDQENLNQRMNDMPADKLSNSMSGLAKSLGSVYAVSKVINLSDQYTLATSRLSLLTDEMKAANEQLETTEKLQNKIYSAAQRSRGSYMDMMGTVSKLGILAGESFGSTDEIVAFTEILNKAFTVGGTGSREKSMAMYQLTQAMGSGRLQGDEYRSIIENAPLLAKSIEDYMRNVKGATGSMKDWAAEGKLTADVIRAATFNASDEIQSKFNEIPYTWGQVWEMCKNTFIRVSEPILRGISWIAQNWEILRPVVLGVATAFATYAAIATVVGGISKFLAFASNVQRAYIARKTTATIVDTAATAANTTANVKNSVATGAAAAATVTYGNASFFATAAQWGLTAALLACPITWVILGLLAIIALFYAIIAGINKITGSSLSATGIIVGCIYAVGAILYNIVMFILHLIAAVVQMICALVNNIVTAFGNGIKNIKAFFWDLLATVTKVIAIIAEKLNSLPFISIDVEGLNSAADNYIAKAEAERSKKGKYKDIIAEGNKILDMFEPKNIKDSFNKGYNKGSGWAENITGMFDFGDIPNFDDMIPDTSSLGGANLGNNIGKITDSTTKSSEDLKWLRIIAERKAINKFTTAEIKVDMGGVQNIVNKDLDLDGVVKYLETSLTETMAAVAEGTHI